MSCQGRPLSNRAIQQMLQYELTPFSLLFFFYRSFLCNLFRSNSCLFFLHVIFSPAWTCSNSLLKRHIIWRHKLMYCFTAFYSWWSWCFIFVVREQLKDLSKEYDKSENDLKALQSVGQVCILTYLTQCTLKWNACVVV